jgi:hypothetical protein
MPQIKSSRRQKVFAKLSKSRFISNRHALSHKKTNASLKAMSIFEEIQLILLQNQMTKNSVKRKRIIDWVINDLVINDLHQ